jgi:hypothetical protein
MYRRTTKLLLGLSMMAISSAAHAHGEEVLLFVGGQLIGFVGLLYLMVSKRFPRLFAIAVFLVFSASLWILPPASLPYWLRYTGWGNLLLGLSPFLTLILLHWRAGIASAKADSSDASRESADEQSR